MSSENRLQNIELNTELLWLAYQQGAFPMTDDDGVIRFYQPTERAIFPNLEMHISRTLKRVLERSDYEVLFDTDFEGVIRGCFRAKDNWLSDELVALYLAAHDEGWAHSCEIRIEGRLAGGIFGTAIGGVFSADSMFHRYPNMSKVALYYMLKKLRSSGFELFDAQIINPHTASLGCVEISGEEYLQIRRIGLAIETDWGHRYAASSSA
ncbi:MAG: leucyl/phenylalanyl-tRNA--protein transferase [Fimbriimonadaceae bacterium]